MKRMEVNSISRFFDHLALIDENILIDLTREDSIAKSGKQLLATIGSFATYLASHGIHSGDTLLAILDNTAETAVLLLAAMRYGIIVFVQPVGSTEDNLRLRQSECKAKVIFNASRIRHDSAVWIDLDHVSMLPSLTYSEVIHNSPFIITESSGSTGKPKRIVHNAQSLICCANTFNRKCNINGSARFLNVMPMYYMAGIFNGLIAPLEAGACVIIDKAFNTKTAMTFWSIVRNNDISATWLSPAMLSMMMQLDRSVSTNNTSLKQLFVGTGHLSQNDAIAFSSKYQITPKQSYGLSELLYVTVNTNDGDFTTVGTTLEGVELKVDYANNLLIRSPFSFMGYWIDGEVKRHDQLFRTTDLALITKEGKLRILGRSDDVIIRGGVNINPILLEESLKPLITEIKFCISGQKDDILGTKVVLVTEGVLLDSMVFHEAQSLVKSLPGIFQLDDTLQISKIPVSSTGKVLRAQLRKKLDCGELC